MRSGQKYDFHGGCDLVLLQNPDFANKLGLTIHIRTKMESWWSYIEAVVVQIGDQMIEFQGREDDGTPIYWVNGLSGDDHVQSDANLMALQNQLRAHMPGFAVIYKKLNSKDHQFRIDLNLQGDAISFRNFKKWVQVNVKANKAEHFAGTKGLMGSYPTGALVARDGDTVMTDTDAFGKEWQVLSTEPMLFHEVKGVQHPEVCAMPDATTMAATKKRRLGESLVIQEAAEFACAGVDEDNFDACVFDVLATNDVEFAGAY